MAEQFQVGGAQRTVAALREADGAVSIEVDGQGVALTLREVGEGVYEVLAGGRTDRAFLVEDGERTHVHLRGRCYEVERLDPLEQVRRETRARGGQDLVAPMPGVIVAVRVALGDEVAAGDTVVVIESMKLQTNVATQAPGRVAALPFAASDSFDKGALLARIAPLESLETGEEPG